MPKIPIHQVCNQLVHDGIYSLLENEFSSLLTWTTLLVRDYLQMGRNIANEVFEKSPERNGYIVALNPDPPDDYGPIILDGAMEHKWNPMNVIPIYSTVDCEERVIQQLSYDKFYKEQLDGALEVFEDSPQQDVLILPQSSKHLLKIAGVEHKRLLKDGPDGNEHWAYSGDFGHIPNDVNYCLNGIVWPDRTLYPVVHEVKYLYQPIKISFKEGTIKITNTNFFQTMQALEFNWTALVDGCELGSGILTLPIIEPQNFFEIKWESCKWYNIGDCYHGLWVAL